MTNPNLNTYELTPEDNACIDEAIEVIRKREENANRNDENYLNFVRRGQEELLIKQNSTITLTLPLTLAEHLANASHDHDPDTALELNRLAKEQAGIYLF